MIRENIIKKINDEPLIFAEILKRYNKSDVLQPDTLKRQLQRNSKIVRTSVVIADYFREKGYSETEIFEAENETK